jgi:ribose 5-phosphate isomerase B
MNTIQELKDGKKKIIIGSDHAGFNLKKVIKSYLMEKNLYDVVDVGTDSLDSCDFPDYAEKLCQEVLNNKENIGIVICGSGIGVSITANKIPGIRCGLVHDYLTAKLARQHTNCNVVAFGEFIIGTLQAKNVVDSFLGHELINEEKYIRRINKISEIEKKYR